MQNLFEAYLGLVLAHSIVYESKLTHSPNGIVDDARCGGDPPAQGVQESTNQQLQAYIQNLPQLLSTTAGQLAPTEQAIMDAQKQILPQQNQLQYDLFSQYAPLLNQIGQQINSSNASAASKSAADVLSGPDAQRLVSTSQDLQKQLDPEYYKTRELTSNRLADLMDSIDLNGLSGSERAEVERANNRSDASRGIANTPSQTATVQNAMTFGNALQTKRNSLAQAIQTATSFLPTSKSGQDAFSLATGTGSSPNQGASQFQGVSPVNGADVFNSGNNLMSGISADSVNQQNINANRRDSLDRTTGVLGSLPSISG